MDWFFCIVFSYIVLKYWLKSKPFRFRNHPKYRHVKTAHGVPINIPAAFTEQEERRKVDKQRQREIEDLKRQGYTDDLIAMIIPVIDN